MKKIIMSFMALILFTVFIGTISPEYASAEETSEMKTLIFHYLSFEDDYDDVILHLWNTGAGGSGAGLEKAGMDDFGAYYEIKIGAGASNVGIIPYVLEEGGNWNKKTFDGKDLIVDVSYLFSEEDPSEMHVFFMQNGPEVYHYENYDPENMNYVYVIYAEEDARYEGWGFYVWGTGTNGTQVNWGDFHPFGGTSYTTTYSFPFKLGIIAVDEDASDQVGFIPANGSEQTADIMIDVTDLKEEGTQGKFVYYIYKPKGSVENDGLEESKEAFFEKVNEFIVQFKFKPYNQNPDMSKQETKGTYAMSPNAIQVEFNQAVLVGKYEDGVVVPIDEEIFSPSFFTLKDEDGNEYEIVVNYLDTLIAVSNFVITFKDENFRLDHTKTYTLYFDNGLTDPLAQQKAEIQFDMDTEAPEIELIDGETVIEINQYEEFKFPDYAASDNRDGDITGKVYVPEGKGYLDTGKAGDQKITLAVSDDWGHVTELEITVRVKEVKAKGLDTGLLIGLIAGGVVILGGAGVLIFTKRKSA